MTTLEQLDTEIKELIRSHRNSDDISGYSSALIFMAGILIIALLVLFILEGYDYKMLIVVLVMFYLFMTYRIRIGSAAKELEKVNIDTPQDGSFNPENILLKVKYLNAGLNVKRARIKSVRQFYVFTTPLFLILMKEILHGPQTARFIFWSLIITLVLSYFVWRAFFASDNDALDIVNKRAETIAKEVNSKL